MLCGIDAEWPPDETLAEAPSGGPPHATLVQLALWLPPGAPTPPQHALGDSGGPCVLLLDLLALPPAAAKRALQSLFRNRACLKLGFGLVHDLRAIAAALGDEGGSCIAGAWGLLRKRLAQGGACAAACACSGTPPPAPSRRRPQLWSPRLTWAACTASCATATWRGFTRQWTWACLDWWRRS